MNDAELIKAIRALANSSDDKCDDSTVSMLGKKIVLHTAADQLEELQDKLSASQARERAADICGTCNLKNTVGCHCARATWRRPQQREELKQMDKLQALNSLEIVDSSVSQGECEYVLAEATAKNIEVLLKAGFTSEQIDDAIGDDKTEIDLSMLAFMHTDAEWWDHQNGFTIQAGEVKQDE